MLPPRRACASSTYSYALIFPACDVASAYPLAAITLGNNLMSAWASDKVAMVSRYRHFRLLFRLVAAVPPLAGAYTPYHHEMM